MSITASTLAVKWAKSAILSTFFSIPRKRLEFPDVESYVLAREAEQELTNLGYDNSLVKKYLDDIKAQGRIYLTPTEFEELKQIIRLTLDPVNEVETKTPTVTGRAVLLESTDAPLDTITVPLTLLLLFGAWSVLS